MALELGKLVPSKNVVDNILLSCAFESVLELVKEPVHEFLGVFLDAHISRLTIVAFKSVEEPKRVEALSIS